MRPKAWEIELKVGLFISIGVGLIMLAIILLGGAESFLTKHNGYTAHFDSVDGLIPGAKVVLGGIRIGMVDAVEIDSQSRNIRVGLQIDERFKVWLRADSTAEVETQGVMGDKYVSITAGSSGEPELPVGGDIKAGGGKGIGQLLDKGGDLIGAVGSLAKSLDSLIIAFRKENRHDRFFSGMADTAQNLGKVSAKLDEQLDQGNLKEALRNLKEILEKVNNGTGTLGALVNDPALYYDAKSLVGGANRNRIMRNLVRKTIQDSREEAAEEAEEPKGQ